MSKWAILFFFFSLFCQASPNNVQQFEKIFKQKKIEKAQLKEIEKYVKANPKESVPFLLTVMKDESIIEKNRWPCFFWLASITGKESSRLLSLFLNHPSWMIRLAALKSLASLGGKENIEVITKRLKDVSILVKIEAIKSLVFLKAKEKASFIWSMIFDSSNYHTVKGKKRRSGVIAAVIWAVGELGLVEKMRELTILSKDKGYSDLKNELSGSIKKLSFLKKSL